MKYFLYARRSTDEDDRQMLSIEAQLVELREFAMKERLEIVEVFTESRTAKKPGRPIFRAMIERIQNGEASGIVAWHPDRLSRNSVEGGEIVYLLDTGVLSCLRFPTFWFENTPQGKFVLSIALGMAKYAVDNLGEIGDGPKYNVLLEQEARVLCAHATDAASGIRWGDLPRDGENGGTRMGDRAGIESGGVPVSGRRRA